MPKTTVNLTAFALRVRDLTYAEMIEVADKLSDILPGVLPLKDRPTELAYALDLWAEGYLIAKAEADRQAAKGPAK